MKINEYQDLAFTTANQSLNEGSQLMNAALGLAGESGEFADLLKKMLYQGHQVDKSLMIKELGDICWYVALAATAMKVPLEEVMQTNIDKLKARYPEGFNADRSTHRNKDDV